MSEVEEKQEQSAEDKPSLNNEGQIPYSRFQEVNTKYKELASKLEKMEAEAKAKDDQLLIEQNRFEELYKKEQERSAKLSEELEPLKGFKMKYDEWHQTTRNELLEQFDPEEQEIYANLELEALKKLAKKMTKNIPTSNASDKPIAQGKFGGYSSITEWASSDPKGYAQARKTGKVRVG